MQDHSIAPGDDALAAAIQVHVEDGVALVTLDRAERRNALTFALWRRLGETFTSLGKRSDVRTIILTGNGTSFCAGADISEFGQVRADAAQALEYEHAYEGCCNAIAATPKATIAAVKASASCPTSLLKVTSTAAGTRNGPNTFGSLKNPRARVPV